MNRENICEKALAELKRGDMNALSVLYDTVARQIFSLAYTITGNYCDAEDALQNTMIDIASSCGGYKGGKPLAWILTITRHNSLDIVRKRQKEAELSLEDVADGEVKRENEEFALLETMDMLSMLNEDEKQIVLMRIYSRLPYSEIADVMGIKVFAAQKKYQRAISKLKKYNP